MYKNRKILLIVLLIMSISIVMSCKKSGVASTGKATEKQKVESEGEDQSSTEIDENKDEDNADAEIDKNKDGEKVDADADITASGADETGEVITASGTDEEKTEKAVEEESNLADSNNIINYNEKAILYNPKATNKLLTISDINSDDPFLVKGAKSNYTYYLEIVDTNDTSYYSTSINTKLGKASGNRFALKIGMPVEKWRKTPPQIIVRIQVKDNGTLYASRILPITRSGLGDLFTLEDLENLNTYPYESFVLKNDITIPKGKAVPFGTDINPFAGKFDGGGHQIKGFKIYAIDKNNIGFFANIANAEVSNIRFTDFSLNGNDFIGAVAGTMSGSTISRIYVEGNITGDRGVGGIAGSQIGKKGKGSVIDMVFVNGEISGNQDIGGIVGRQEKSIVRNALIQGRVIGKRTVGGVVGRQSESRIELSYVGALISGEDDIGVIVGLVGFQKEKSIEYVYYLNDIELASNSIEVVGYIDFDGGGLEVDEVYPLDQEEITEEISFTGFDFSNIWNISNKGPSLRTIK